MTAQRSAHLIEGFHCIAIEREAGNPRAGTWHDRAGVAG